LTELFKKLKGGRFWGTPATSCATSCMNTVGCTTGWVNYANKPSQAVLELSSQDAYDVVRLTRSKAAVWTVE